MPRFVSLRTFIYLWLLLGPLVLAAVLTARTQVPFFATGPAIVVSRPDAIQSINDEQVLALYLDAQHGSQLQAGQLIHSQDERGQRFEAQIIAVLPEVLSPVEAQEQFALTGSAAQAIAQPVVVAIARWQPPDPDIPPAVYQGTVYQGSVAAGTRPLSSYLFSGDSP